MAGWCATTCSVLVGGVRVHLALPNGATLPNPARNSKRKARPRKGRDDQNPRNALTGNVPVTACKSSPALEEDFAQRRRDAKVGLTQFIPSSFAPWRLCARPSSSNGQSSGKGMGGKGMIEIGAWHHSLAFHSSAIRVLFCLVRLERKGGFDVDA